jgi:hypothetical protein
MRKEAASPFVIPFAFKTGRLNTPAAAVCSVMYSPQDGQNESARHRSHVFETGRSNQPAGRINISSRWQIEIRPSRIARQKRIPLDPSVATADLLFSPSQPRLLRHPTARTGE